MEEDSDSSNKKTINENNVNHNSVRVEIDTSPPFESVKEAVDLFGGSGQWIPLHSLRLTNKTDDVFDIEELKESLTMKEHQALNVLRQLEAAKTFVRELKLNHLVPPCLIFGELNKAKLSLNKTFTDLALIQASVESLNEKITSDKVRLENQSSSNASSVSTSMSRDGDFETGQFKKMTEASRYEVVKAITEIERTKNSIRLAEMRLNAAKKMEEAAKALEAIAVAERKGRSLQSDPSNGVIKLSSEEYETLVRKANKAEETICKNKFIDSTNDDLVVPVLDKFEEITKETTRSTEINMFRKEARHHHHHRTNVVVEDHYSRTDRDHRSVKFKFRNSHPGYDKYESSKPSNDRTTTSIGDILNRKLTLQDHDDDHTIGSDSERRHQHVSLGQMLREQSRLIVHTNENNVATDLGSVISNILFRSLDPLKWQSRARKEVHTL